MTFEQGFRIALKESGLTDGDINERIRAANSAYPSVPQVLKDAPIKPEAEQLFIAEIKKWFILVNTNPKLRAEVNTILNSQNNRQ